MGNSIEIFPYDGYPKWRMSGYAEQVEVLTQIFAQFGSSLGEYSQESLDGRITRLCDIICQKKQAKLLTNLEHLAILTKLR